MHRITRIAACLACAGVALAAAGCGGVERVPLNGDVTLDGQPLPDGSIVFLPAGGQGGPKAVGRIVQGKYSIPADEGPSPGALRVEIFGTAQPVYALDEPQEHVAHLAEPLPNEPLPAEYNVQSQLSADAQRGAENRFDFALQSHPAS
jgi:hypothetical protein